MANFYSQYYATNVDGRTRSFHDPVTAREGEPAWMRAVVAVPATAVAGDVLFLGQVLEGNRPMNGRVKATGVNGAMTIAIGYVGSANAILPASNIAAAAGSTDLTAAQIGAITYRPPIATEAIVTIGGTVANATTLTFELDFALETT